MTRADKYKNIHSILIVKNGKLVLEEYFNGHRYLYSADQCKGEFTEFGKDTLHNTHSVTKIFTSSIIGIAISKGFIKNVNEKVFTFFPKYSHLNNDRKAKITIKHLLTMTSGLEWNEMDVDYLDPSKNDVVRMFNVDDPIKFILEKPAVTEPGTRWYYSGGDVILLGEIIKSVTGMNITEFAIKHLFTPLGITDAVWTKLTSEVIYTSGDIYMRPRDMAKIGQLYLNNGVWNGRKILSKEWIDESIETHVKITNPNWRKFEGDSYGYHWFFKTFHSGKKNFKAFLRSGWGGQLIGVFPKVDMVVVFTGGNYTSSVPVHKIITDYILSSVQ